jgi:cytochrome c-type biogenesis protein CcmE
MSFLPRSKTARRRFMMVIIAAPVLAAGVGLGLLAMRDQVVYFYTPAEAYAAAALGKGGAGLYQTMRLGGLVKAGSVLKGPDGQVRFVVADQKAEMTVQFKGDLPDLFREGQGVVCEGKRISETLFEARTVLAKHDETYMPKEVTKALKAQGEWHPESLKPTPPKPFGGKE